MSTLRARYGEAVNGSRVLVTGARGLLGSHLVPLLVRLGARVHATSRTKRDGADLDVQWWEGEYRSHSDLSRLLSEIHPTVVFHLAGAVTGRNSLGNVLPTFHSLLESTVNLLELASHGSGPRVVLAGSFLEPNASDAEPSPTSGYAAAKWAGSAYARMFRDLYQTPVVISMPFMCYGPHQNPNKLVAHVASSLLAGRSPEILSSERRVDWVYAGDVAEGLVACGFEPAALGRTLDLGSGTYASVRDLVEMLSDLIGGPVRPRYVERAPGAPPLPVERVADIRPARECLGWTARTSLREGLSRTVEWLRGRACEMGSA